MYQDGQRRTVCDNGWDNREARVVCRQLGFSGNINRRLICLCMKGKITCLHPNNFIAVQETSVNVFGRGSGEIIEVRWGCGGRETNLLECSKYHRNCGHDRDAGVYCFGNPLLIIS